MKRLYIDIMQGERYVGEETIVPSPFGGIVEQAYKEVYRCFPTLKGKSDIVVTIEETRSKPKFAS